MGLCLCHIRRAAADERVWQMARSCMVSGLLGSVLPLVYVLCVCLRLAHDLPGNIILICAAR